MLKKYRPVAVILIIELVLFFTNYKPGTFLIGWDNLYPELNIRLNLARTLVSTWQEYRSLGLFDVMSHAANLPHDVFRMMLSLILPLNLVRWFFIFFTHLMGGIGMYILLFSYILKRYESGHPAGVRAASLFGALFYQYNLITTQMFFLPFELFLIHYAALPFLIFYSLTYLESGRLKDLIIFFSISFLTTSQSHVPTIFIVYLIATGLLFLAKILTEKKQVLKRILILTLIIFCANAYWGIPFALSTLKNSDVVANSKNNQMATDDIFYRNLKFGDFPDVATLKGISLDYVQYDYQTNISHFMMEPWLIHLHTLQSIIPSWLFFAIMALGLISSIRYRALLPFILIFLFSFSMMANDTPGVTLISKVMRDYVPFFHNVFRFVFTKFAFLYGFSYTIFLAIGAYELLRFARYRKVRIALSIGIAVCLLLYGYPSFRGHFFYKNLASTLPQGYFSAFSFFQKQDYNQRVAMLPLPWYWAWTQNNWNTIGSGFIWYGIPQPMADRAFDPWSDKNENFYWELDQAIYADSVEVLESVLNKYDIHWILFDKSVYHGAAPKIIPSRYEQLFDRSVRIRSVMSEDPVVIYSYNNPDKQKNFVSIKSNLPNIGPSYVYDNLDIASRENGYITDPEKPYARYYPFRSLFSGKSANDSEFQVEETQNAIVFSAPLDKQFSKQRLQIPPVYFDEFKIFSKDNLETVTYYKPVVYLNNLSVLATIDISDQRSTTIQLPEFQKTILKISIPKAAVTYYDSKKGNFFLAAKNTACSTNPEGVATLKKNITPPPASLKFTSVNSFNCINIDLFELMDQRYGYLTMVDVMSENPHKGLFFGIINNTTRKTDIETYFDHDLKRHRYPIIISPRNYYGLGYTFNFNNISFGREKVVNTLERFAVYRIPYYFLKELSIAPEGKTMTQSVTNIPQTVEHPIFSEYIVSGIPDTKNGILYLSQGFDNGWKAYAVKRLAFGAERVLPFIFGKEIKEHFVVNNWANGWKLDPRSQMSDVRFQGSDIRNQASGISDQTSVILVFWPQYLQFIGFGILFITAGALFFFSRKSS